MPAAGGQSWAVEEALDVAKAILLARDVVFRVQCECGAYLIA